MDPQGEGGLLGLTFHPNFQSNGFFYVNYTAPNPFRTVISRFQVSSNPNKADEASETVILSFNQPFSNHNSGQIRFGPKAFLYISMGDGGGDPGKMCRTVLICSTASCVLMWMVLIRGITMPSQTTIKASEKKFMHTASEIPTVLALMLQMATFGPVMWAKIDLMK